MRRITSFILCLIMLFSLSACGSADKPTPEKPSVETDDLTPPAPEQEGEQPSMPEVPVGKPDPTPTPYEILDPTVMPEGGEKDGVKYVAYRGVVEHMFFHPVIAYPEQAFDGDNMSNGYDDWMVTVDEYNKILNSVYEKGYILVDITDCWSETTDEAGNPQMVKNTLYLPEGKKPLIISYDDVNYNYYTLGDGFTYKLIFGEDGKLWSWGLDPAGKEVVSRDLDAITILDKFVEEHPDFSPFGAKGCLSITGYEGILGYRTHTDKEGWTAAKEANRQKEIEAVKPIVAELKRTGWTFGSHTFGHIRLSEATPEYAQADMTRWLDEVGSLVGDVSVLFYPFGARLDGDDVKQTGPAMQRMIEQGFRIFCSVGVESYSKIKKDACAVICDRLHPDGTTLRTNSGRNRYMKFYDAKDIIDLDIRPEREVGWLKPAEPAKPVAPVVPETPVAPVVPETPVAPVVPETPVAPVVPETPVENTPEVPAPGADIPAEVTPEAPAENVSGAATPEAPVPEAPVPEVPTTEEPVPGDSNPVVPAPVPEAAA